MNQLKHNQSIQISHFTRQKNRCHPSFADLLDYVIVGKWNRITNAYLADGSAVADLNMIRLLIRFEIQLLYPFFARI